MKFKEIVNVSYFPTLLIAFFVMLITVFFSGVIIVRLKFQYNDLARDYNRLMTSYKEEMKRANDSAAANADRWDEQWADYWNGRL